MSEENYEVVLSGGGPFGFRLQGGKEFGRGLAIQSITAGGKADSRGICSGDSLSAINGQSTEGMTHIEAQNAIKRSQTLKLSLIRKPGNIAVSMGKKDAVVKVDTTHSAKVDYKYNSKPKPFGAPKSAPAPVKSPTPKPAPPPVEKKEDNLEDSEVLKMLRNSNLSEESTGLRRTGQGRKISMGSDFNDDDMPPPPPEAFEEEEEAGPQSRTFRMLEKSINSGEEHPSALSQPPPNPPSSTRITAPKPYNPPSHSRPPQTITVHTGSPPRAPAYNKPASSYGGAPAPAASRPPPQPAPAAPRPSAPAQKKPGTPSCEQCGEVIQGPFVSALGRNWHPEHFCCGGCQRSLQNVGFVEEGGLMYCESCYNQRFAPKCASCNQPIIGVSVKALGKVYHQEHFTCTHCGKQLAGEGFHVENGDPYCSQDYKELFCVKCYSCKQIIRAGDRWMEAINQKWHADCFRCMTCGIVLENTGFYSAGNRVFCPDHS
ncbi:PDZ and LIM domain protein 5-like [Dendronephthya gigantea]|uniref:PDZ and LIM domain protein 5-like n=1 Tax=Dendronephthya gigantea TaxID=151771 RepID=UPI00106C8D4A|nr:PDZ and LIM domain protein 5-like [Dendronephthya gigantea]